MATSTQLLDVTDREPYLAGVHVTTEDATNTTREYHIYVPKHETIGGEYVLAGSRVDDDRPSDEFEQGPSETAWDAAAEHFKDRGYSIYGR